jgi:hypothetical protein
MGHRFRSADVAAVYLEVRCDMKGVKNAITAALVGAVGVGASGLAMAQDTGLDVSGVTTQLTSAGTAIGTVALGMIGVAGAGIAVKWFLGWLFS